MSENGKLKHLEFIQAVITRMGTNYFLIKGWSVTLVAALFALAAKDANGGYVILVYIPIPVFWGLDAYYLSQERKYRDLFKRIAATPDTAIDFNMNATSSDNRLGWLACLFSRTVFPFYGVLAAVTGAVMFLIPYMKMPHS